MYKDIAGGPQAWESLLEIVKGYFFSPSTTKTTRADVEVHQTELPPIYLQRPRHSLTVIGIEERTDGSCNLLVFDPAFSPSRAMRTAVLLAENGTALKVKDTSKLLKPYRHGKPQLQFPRFETLILTDVQSKPLALDP